MALRSLREVFENLLQGDEGQGFDQRRHALMDGAGRQQGGKGRPFQPLGRSGEVMLAPGPRAVPTRRRTCLRGLPIAAVTAW